MTDIYPVFRKNEIKDTVYFLTTIVLIVLSFVLMESVTHPGVPRWVSITTVIVVVFFSNLFGYLEGVKDNARSLHSQD